VVIHMTCDNDVCCAVKCTTVTYVRLYILYVLSYAVVHMTRDNDVCCAVKCTTVTYVRLYILYVLSYAVVLV